MITRLTIIGALFCLCVAGQAPPALAQERLRWELVTDGVNQVGGDGTSAENPVPNLSSPSASFLFRLDLQPQLLKNATVANVAHDAKFNHHIRIETGIVPRSRTVVAKAEPALSDVADTLAAQGATISGATTAAPTISSQRAFTAGFEYTASGLMMADASRQGAFAELGVVARGHFDAFLDNERFFEKDGLTYVKVSNSSDDDAGFFRTSLGVRARLTQFEEGVEQSTGSDGGNAADLLVFELLYEHAGALKGLVPDESTQHRYVMRFVATPYVTLKPSAQDAAKRTKFLLGVELDQDLARKGKQNIRVFYGVNMDLKRLFTD